MHSRFLHSLPRRVSFHAPGSGVLVVFRQQMRARRPIRDLIWMTVLVGCHAALAIALRSATMPMAEYSSDTPRFLLRLVSMAALVGPLLYLPISAGLGAFAAPPASRFEETQSMLLTHLSPFDVCAGRLLAWMWPVTSSVLASCALVLAGQLASRAILDGSAAGYAAIVAAHAVLLAASFATGAIALLFAVRQRPGRVWARGAVAGLAVAAVALSALFVVNPLVRRMDNPTTLISGALLINPSIAASAAYGMDALRIPWLYERTEAPEYPFSYPPPLASCAVFAGSALVALTISSMRLRRAYR